MSKYLEAAYLEHSTVMNDGKHLLTKAEREHVRDIIAAWVGDRTLYEPCSDCGGSGVIQVSDTKGIECQLCRFSPTVMILEVTDES